MGLEVFLEALDEIGGHGVGGIGLVEEGGNHNALGVRARVIGDGLVLPGVARGDGGRDAKLAGLLNQQGRGGDGAGREDDIRVLGLDLGEDGLEVGLVGLELLLHNRAAQRGEGLYEEAAEAGAIVVAQLGDNGGLLGAFLPGIVGHYGALEGIEEAYAIVVIVAQGNLRVGAGKADRGDLVLGKDFAGRDGHAAAVGAQHHGYARGHQALGRGNGLGLIGLVIRFDQLDLVFHAADVDGGPDFVGIADGKNFLIAAAAVLAGEGLKNADLDDLVTALPAGSGGRAAAAKSCKGQNHYEKERKHFLHVSFLRF